MKRALDGVKVGDTIKVLGRYGQSFSLHTVKKVMATRVTCEEASFMIDSGAQIGTRTTGQWSTAKYGELVPADEVDKLRAQLDLRRRITNAQLAIDRIVIKSENLEAAEALIAASKPKQGAQ